MQEIEAVNGGVKKAVVTGRVARGQEGRGVIDAWTPGVEEV